MTEIARVVGSARDVQEILPEVCGRAARLCGADRGTLFLWGDDSKEVYPASSESAGGASEEGLRRLGRELGSRPLAEDRLISHLASTREGVHIDDARGSPLINRDSVEAFGLRTIFGIPLVAEDEVIGALLLDRREVRPFDERERELGTAAADLIALVLQKGLMLDRLVRAEKDRALAEMAGGVAHDFNNLLAAILGRTQVLLQSIDLDQLTAREGRRNLAIIQQAARQGAEIVRHLLEHTRAVPDTENVEAVGVDEILSRTLASRPRSKSRPNPQRTAFSTLAGRTLRVLVVDDEASVREVLGEVLSGGGHEVWQAGSGDEGLKLLETQTVDLVLTDLRMPGMTGWEVAREVKRRWPAVKVGLISGWSPEGEREELEEHGVDFLCSKPFEVEDLLGTLATL